MLNVSELKRACEYTEKEYGSDTSVVIQIYDTSGKKLLLGDQALSAGWLDNGTLIITNTSDKESSK